MPDSVSSDVMSPAATTDTPVIIIGGGPCGIRSAQELSKLGKNCIVFNAERWRPYNRVKLTPLLAGEIQIGQVYQAPEFNGSGKVVQYDDTLIAQIDKENKTVTAANGRSWEYSQLILAFGSKAFIPNIPGKNKSGVYAFRDANDVEALLARSVSARHVCVIGGGLLGLEAARGMSKRGIKVTVIEHENRLMPRQLDDTSGEILARNIEELGVDVMTSTRVGEILGDDRVEALRLGDGRELACDTVIICTGVRANLNLAREAGIRTDRAVLVDDQMRTSEKDIYAVGECAEHNGIVYGLVGPGLEQSAIAARTIADQDAEYKGSMSTTKLKVIGAEVFSMGDVEELEARTGVKKIVYQERDKQIYRKLFIERGRIVGALGVGNWPEASKLQQAILDGQTVYPWTSFRFKKTGSIWKDSDDDSAYSMPPSAIICNCTGVTRGQIGDAITLGACSIKEIQADTGANTVCGTCTALVEEILAGGAKVEAKPVKLWQTLLAISTIAVVLALITLSSPRIPLPDSFEANSLLQKFWFDTTWKQWSGYILLGLTTIAAILSMRKRINWLQKLGSYDVWRVIHLAIGAIATIVLFFHTGFRIGDNLNLVLMLFYLAVLLFGAIAGLTTGGEHELKNKGYGDNKNPPRKIPTWVHILTFWPIPILLAIHIVTVYSF